MRLIGYVDGVEISFDFYPPNIFRGIIPKRLNGKYVVELKVTDNAGNENGMTDILVYIDFQKMKFKVLDESYRFATTDKFRFKEVKSQFSFKELIV